MNSFSPDNRNLWKRHFFAALTLAITPICALAADKTPLIDQVPIDYSYCGYMASADTIPTVPTAIVVPCGEGDMTDVIQQAIDKAKNLMKFYPHSAVQLEEGTYHLCGRLKLRDTGVTLRGAGADKTRLVFEGVSREPGILIEGKAPIISNDTIRPNENGEWPSIPGLSIVVIHPSTKEWIAQHNCDIYGGGISALGWKPGDVDLHFWRHPALTDEEEKATYLTTYNQQVKDWQKHRALEAPIPMNCGEDDVIGFWAASRSNWYCGIEDLTIAANVIGDNPKDEQHLWTGISIENARDCWVRCVNFENLAGSGVIVQPNAQRITIEDCIYRHPVSEEANLRRNAFYILGQQVLVQRCVADHAMHAFATGWAAAGPNAFVQCEAREAFSYSGAVEAWSTGLLMDIVDIDGHDIMMDNIGQDNNGAGWTAANATCWNCTAAEIHCSSPDSLNENRAYGSWCQFSGNGIWKETNNHISPRSLYYAQLERRLKANGDSMKVNPRILPRNLDASSSPTYEQAQEAARIARTEPRLTLEKWVTDIQRQSRRASFADAKTLAADSKAIGHKNNKVTADAPAFAIENGHLTLDGRLALGGKYNTPWWNGKTRPNYLAKKAQPALTRHVPDREGTGLTDRIDSVVAFMERNNYLAYDQCYGLWYDRRRDDHERVRRRDAQCWAPFYEQPWDRSGEGTAWEGLSRYDLTKPNLWYYSRLRDFCKAAPDRMLYLEHYFQHNILEAGAHWVDCPWRPVNNVNGTVFPEPVPFTGDKRVFVAEWFYDEQNPTMRELHRQYIRQNLEQFRDCPNAVHLIGEEYTGPLHFTRFWLECIAEWEAETGMHPLVALAATKDVQDSLLADPRLSKVIDIIQIQYWFYRVPDKRNPSDIWAPGGGLNMAPRQHMRRQQVGKTGFAEAYRSVYEYTSRFPDKAVTFYAQTYPQLGWAILMAGGSCCNVTINDDALRRDIATMRPKDGETAKVLSNGSSALIYFTADGNATLDGLKSGSHKLMKVDHDGTGSKAGSIKVAADGTLAINGKANEIYWIK